MAEKYLQKPKVSLAGKTLKDFPEVLALWHPKKNGKQKPHDLRAGSSAKFWWKCPLAPDHEWQAMLVNVASALVKYGTFACPSCWGKQVSVTNRFDKLAPHLVQEWDFTKNSLAPDQVSYSSNKRVWWKCSKGPDHEWTASINARTSRGTGCPCCRNLRVSVTNRLDMVAPFLIPDWDFERSRPLLPNQVTFGSHRRVWWRCSKGPDHIWQARIRDRVQGLGCPFCSSRRLSIAKSLANVRPDLVKQWHPTKNGTLKPTDLMAGSVRRVWWKCPNGPDHEWQSSPNTRRPDCVCPFCGRAPRRVSSTNSLATLAPHLITEWHPTKNGAIRPQDVTLHSAFKAWWKCLKGPDHEWKTAVCCRTGHKRTGCPCCSGLKLSVTNSLATRFPKIARQWHPTKNGDLRPDQVVAGSNRKAWWRCEVGHEWLTKVYLRTSHQTGCPGCNRRKRKVAMTGKQRKSAIMPSYEGVRAGPVKRIR